MNPVQRALAQYLEVAGTTSLLDALSTAGSQRALVDALHHSPHERVRSVAFSLLILTRGLAIRGRG